MKTPSTEAGSLRAALTDEEIDKIADEHLSYQEESRSASGIYEFANACARAALSAAPRPEPEISMDSLNQYLGRGHQTESADKTAAPNDSDTERDAKRYRFLKTLTYWDAERDMGPGGRWWLAVLVRKGTPTFDAAVDAAMKEQPPT